LGADVQRAPRPYVDEDRARAEKLNHHLRERMESDHTRINSDGAAGYQTNYRRGTNRTD